MVQEHCTLWWWWVMVWCSFRSSGASQLCRLDGKFYLAEYLNMLSNIVEPFAPEIMPSNWIYQQDNSSVHAAPIVKKWFKDHNFNLLDWPPQSPDLSPIENLWAIIKRQLKHTKCKNYLQGLEPDPQNHLPKISEFSALKNGSSDLHIQLCY